MVNEIKKLLDKKGILAAAHRGIAGGNIPCNTMEAFEAALGQGADFIELDVSISKDGKLFVFHPGMEPAHLMSEKLICDMTAAEVEQLHFVNYDNVPTKYPVSYLEDVLKRLKGRCFVNIDKFWTCMQEITDMVRKLGMEEQVLVKTSAEEKWLAQVEQIAPDFAFMPIIRDNDTVTDDILNRNINYVGAEVLFDKEEKQVAGKAYIQKMHDKGLMLWANAIVYNDKEVLTAGHNDDISIAGNPDDGWGWLAEQGFDIIQTDWPLPALEYYRKTGVRKD